MNGTSHMRQSGGWLSWRLLLVAAIGIYALAGLYQLYLPGLYYDEALDAVPAMQVVTGHALDTAAVFHVAGRPWPLMLMSYVGSTTTYLLVPIFRLLGVGVVPLRLTNWTIGLLALLLAWGMLREYLDERVAGLAVILLAANATFVFWARLGPFVSLPMLPLAIGVFWCLWRWYRSGRGRYLIIAALCFGLGVTTKLLFVWYGLGLAAGWLVLSPWISRTRGWRGLALAPATGPVPRLAARRPGLACRPQPTNLVQPAGTGNARLRGRRACR